MSVGIVYSRVIPDIGLQKNLGWFCRYYNIYMN
nr:MAG TPA: hypothetical protein [Caudoviricetes sp.]